MTLYESNASHTVAADNVEGILALADEYLVNGVKSKCEKVLLSQHESLEYLVLAQTYSLQELYKKCVAYAQKLDVRMLQESPVFKHLTNETLIEILANRVIVMQLLYF